MKMAVSFEETNQNIGTNFSESSNAFSASFGEIALGGTGSGKDGESAYQIALNNGFEGTEEEWLQSLHGKDGVDGKNGIDGRNGIDGKDGYTPQKGIDYFDGKDGKDGQNGKDGVNGKDGYTPVKGTDYWTEEEKTEIVSEVLSNFVDVSGVGY